MNGVNAVGCLPAGEELSAGQTAIDTVQAGVTSSTPSVTSTTMSTTASTTGECDSSLTEHTPRNLFISLIIIPEFVSTSATPSPTGSNSNSSGGGGGGLNAVQTAFSVLGPIVGIAALIFRIYAYKRTKKRKDPGSAVNSSSTGGTAPRNHRMEYGNAFELGQNSHRPPPGFNYDPVNV